MTYKETLFFVGKCLTITHEEHNKKIVEQEIKSGNVDWDNVVKVSTAHYVFPALYCNLKRANLLSYLPEELVNYMKHITDLNRERNLQIIEQAKEINNLLLANNITPIFLKGTGNLLEGLYEDIAERMVGDIDFIVSIKQFKIVIQLLKKDSYSESSIDYIDNTIFNRHYPKLTKAGKISSLEVHYKMITNDKQFNYAYIKNNLIKTKKNITILSYNDQVLMTCFNKQINDKGQWYKSISLRNSYDLFLVSKLTFANKVLTSFKHPKSGYLKNFLASSCMIFNNPKSLDYTKTKSTKSFLKKQIALIENPKKNSLSKRKWNVYFLFISRLLKTIKIFYKKEYRAWFIKRLKNRLQN